MEFKALKTAAGKHNFQSGDIVEFDAKQKKAVDELILDGAIEPVEGEKKKPAPKQEAKKEAPKKEA